MVNEDALECVFCLGEQASGSHDEEVLMMLLMLRKAEGVLCVS